VFLNTSTRLLSVFDSCLSSSISELQCMMNAGDLDGLQVAIMVAQEVCVWVIVCILLLNECKIVSLLKSPTLSFAGGGGGGLDWKVDA
jgi:hypothetical protein